MKPIRVRVGIKRAQGMRLMVWLSSEEREKETCLIVVAGWDFW